MTTVHAQWQGINQLEKLQVMCMLPLVTLAT